MRLPVIAGIAALSAITCGGSPTPPTAPFVSTRSIVINGSTRTYTLHVPAGFQPRIGALVVALHGAGSSGPSFERGSGLSAKADQAGFAVVYPDGLFNPRINATDWQHYGDDFSDDVGFLRQLIAVVSADIQSDPRRTYVAGFSNGARLAHRAGVELSDIVAAIGDIGGSLFLGPAQIPAARGPVSVVILHGDADTYCGDPVDASQDQTFDYWAGASGNKCARVNPPGPLCDSAGNITTLTAKSAEVCGAGTVVKFFRLIGGQHTWYRTPLNMPGQIPFNPDLDASTGTFVNDVIWSFFAAHPKG